MKKQNKWGFCVAAAVGWATAGQAETALPPAPEGVARASATLSDVSVTDSAEGVPLLRGKVPTEYVLEDAVTLFGPTFSPQGGLGAAVDRPLTEGADDEMLGLFLPTPSRVSDPTAFDVPGPPLVRMAVPAGIRGWRLKVTQGTRVVHESSGAAAAGGVVEWSGVGPDLKIRPGETYLGVVDADGANGKAVHLERTILYSHLRYALKDGTHLAVHNDPLFDGNSARWRDGRDSALSSPMEALRRDFRGRVSFVLGDSSPSAPGRAQKWVDCLSESLGVSAETIAFSVVPAENGGVSVVDILLPAEAAP